MENKTPKTNKITERLKLQIDMLVILTKLIGKTKDIEALYLVEELQKLIQKIE